VSKLVKKKYTKLLLLLLLLPLERQIAKKCLELCKTLYSISLSDIDCGEKDRKRKAGSQL